VSSPVNVVLRFKHTETILPQSCDVVIVISIALRRYQLGPWHSGPLNQLQSPPSCCWRPQMALMFFCAVVNPNNKFEIYVDQTLIHSGSLLEDMTWVLLILFVTPCTPEHLPALWCSSDSHTFELLFPIC